MFSRFFIERPIFAAVLSIVIVLAGLVTLGALPIAQYPELSPPTVTVSTTFPGANAQVLAETVAAPIEQEVNGVEGMLYMSSTCASDGRYDLTVTFETDVDLDIAAVLVQNRVSIATPKLPDEVVRFGVTTKKQATNFALAVNLTSPEGRYDDIFLRNFATLRLKDPIARIDGVGEVRIFGAADYSMRIWLDPRRLQSRDLTTTDVVNALREQNVQVAAGTVGQLPAPVDQSFQYTVTTLGRLSDVTQFENVIVKTGAEGRVTRVKDVARVELGAENYFMYSGLNAAPATTLIIYQLPGANLLEISDEVRELLADLSSTFPEGVGHTVAYDAGDVVRASIEEIVTTLFIAALLVILTVWVFLQDWRATLIPTVTIPVSLIGTFAVMGVLGFSLNTLTLFGLVLAIGIVVDDAIVVVENVARNIDSGLDAREATIRAMQEVTGPVIATTLVLLAVFVPTAFMGGLTGAMYNQFGLTIAVTTVFSSINALTLSPALCALLLRRSPEKKNVLFRAFDGVLGWVTKRYVGVAGLFVRKAFLAALLLVVLLLAAGWTFRVTPTGFVPMEDQGYIMVNAQLPDAASLDRTMEVDARIDAILKDTPWIANNIAIGGNSMIEGVAGSNFASHIVVLEPWSERPPDSLRTILQHLNRELSQIQEAQAVAFPTPPIPGLGMVSGFDMQVQARSGVGLEALEQIVGELADAGNGQAGLTNLFSGFRATVPQLFADVDREKVKRLGVPLQSVFDTLQAFLGSAYVNDFNKFGRPFKVYAQADSEYRARREDILDLRVRDATGAMIPLGTLMTIEDDFGPQTIRRYNLYPSASLKGQAAPGFSSGQALELMEQMAARTLPESMGYEWTGEAFQQKLAGNQAPLIFGLAILLVYLVLAAQYEAWVLPWAVILAVPLGIVGALLGTLAMGYDNNVYTQIGLVLLVGLVSKNAILIVEFAKERHEAGLSVVEAAIEAARLRFRAILMTAFSFVLGTIPLVVATGAGGGSRRALGTAVFSGMIFATVVGVIMTPGLYSLLQRMSERVRGVKAEPPVSDATPREPEAGAEPAPLAPGPVPEA